MRIARAYHLARGRPSKHKVIGRWGSHQGMTLGALAMGGCPESRRVLAPMLHKPGEPAPPRLYIMASSCPRRRGDTELKGFIETVAAVLAMER